MHVYILDWSGTLDTLSNPKGYVRALQYLGHKVVLWTGHSVVKDPAAAAVDLFVTKGNSLQELVLDVMAMWEPEKVFYSDDERIPAKGQVHYLQTDPDLELPIEFIDPFDLHAHLASLAP